MSKLWAPNPDYEEWKPQSLSNMPYQRLYENLTLEELSELLSAAEQRHWKALNLCCCGLDTLPDMLWQLDNLVYLLLGNNCFPIDSGHSLKGSPNTFTPVSKFLRQSK